MAECHTVMRVFLAHVSAVVKHAKQSQRPCPMVVGYEVRFGSESYPTKALQVGPSPCSSRHVAHGGIQYRSAWAMGCHHLLLLGGGLRLFIDSAQISLNFP